VKIKVDLRGDLARQVTAASLVDGGMAELPGDASVGALASALGLSPASAVFVVNGVAARAGQQLREGDRVQAFPIASGG
jgi:sulfur carrier protein ThiS